LSWNKDTTVNKALVMIGDALPHPPSYTDQNFYWRDEVDELAKLGVKIYGVQAGKDPTSTLFYDQMASASGGVYLNLQKLPLITDMFLAVCYREFGTQHLETYRQEVVAEGRMNAEMTGMFSQLERQNSDLSEKKLDMTKCHQGWYHRDYDHISIPSYYYHADSDKFLLHAAPVAATSKAGKAPKAKAPKASKKRKAVDEAEGEKEKEKEKEKKEEKAEEVPTTSSSKKAASPKKAAPKKKAPAKKKAKKEEEEEEEEVKPLKKNESIVLGTGDWKKDRLGRLVKLEKK